MTERGARHVLGAAPADGGARPTVEADDVYLGGERNQGRNGRQNPRDRACERQADGAMGYVVMKVVASFSAEHVAAFRDAPSPMAPTSTRTACAASRLRRSRNPTHPPGHSHR